MLTIKNVSKALEDTLETYRNHSIGIEADIQTWMDDWDMNDNTYLEEPKAINRKEFSTILHSKLMEIINE